MQEQIKLRREVVRLKREMNAISAQDDFAKWAKIRREHDKVLEAHDKQGMFSTSTCHGARVVSRTLHFHSQRCGLFLLPPSIASQTLTYLTAAASVSSSRGSFDTKAGIIRWLSTSGLRFALQFWHAKTPVFTYPRGWFPWYVEWILGFPRCPYGGVSINVWSTACATVIALVFDVAFYAVSYVRESGEKQKEKGKEKVAVPAGKS